MPWDADTTRINVTLTDDDLKGSRCESARNIDPLHGHITNH